MQTFSQTVAGAASWSTKVKGSFFRLIKGASVDIYFYKNGSQIGSALAMDEGFWLAESDFDEISIFPVDTQDVKFAVSMGSVGLDSSPVINGGSLPSIENIVVAGSDVETIILGQNAKRICIRSQSGNTDYLWISFTGNPAITPHFILSPGDSWEEAGVLIGPSGLEISIYAPNLAVSVDVITWI